eukprot:Nk52_evm1s356 gene=Nk52_evmTU1s356
MAPTALNQSETVAVSSKTKQAKPTKSPTTREKKNDNNSKKKKKTGIDQDLEAIYSLVSVPEPKQQQQEGKEREGEIVVQGLLSLTREEEEEEGGGNNNTSMEVCEQQKQQFPPLSELDCNNSNNKLGSVVMNGQSSGAVAGAGNNNNSSSTSGADGVDTASSQQGEVNGVVKKGSNNNSNGEGLKASDSENNKKKAGGGNGATAGKSGWSKKSSEKGMAKNSSKGSSSAPSGTTMYLGKHIHMSSIDGKPLCSYSKKLCSQRRMDGYGFCIRHVLEDPFCPFKQCLYISKSTNKQCTNPIPKEEEEREYCNSHLQLMGLVSKKLLGLSADNGKRKRRADDASADADADLEKGNNFEQMHNLVSAFRDRDGTKTLTKSEKRKRLAEALDKHGIGKLSSFEERNSLVSRKIRAEMDKAVSTCVYESADEASSDEATDVEVDVNVLMKMEEPWWSIGHNDSNDEDSSEENLSVLDNAKVLTDEELADRRRKQLVKLKNLYKLQFRHLRHTLILKHEKYVKDKNRLMKLILNSTEAVGESDPLPPPVPIAAEPSAVAQTEQSPKATKRKKELEATEILENALLKKTKRTVNVKTSEEVAIAEQAARAGPVSKNVCVFKDGEPCKSTAMPLSKYCFQHILHDEKQVLYVACDWEHNGWSCTNPVVRYQYITKCELHYDCADVDVASEMKRTGMQFSKNYSERESEKVSPVKSSPKKDPVVIELSDSEDKDAEMKQKRPVDVPRPGGQAVRSFKEDEVRKEEAKFYVNDKQIPHRGSSFPKRSYNYCGGFSEPLSRPSAEQSVEHGYRESHSHEISPGYYAHHPRSTAPHPSNFRRNLSESSNHSGESYSYRQGPRENSSEPHRYHNAPPPQHSAYPHPREDGSDPRHHMPQSSRRDMPAYYEQGPRAGDHYSYPPGPSQTSDQRYANSGGEGRSSGGYYYEHRGHYGDYYQGQPSGRAYMDDGRRRSLSRPETVGSRGTPPIPPSSYREPIEDMRNRYPSGVAPRTSSPVHPEYTRDSRYR